MVSQYSAPPAAEPTPPACCHHWIIEPANGPVSQGICLKCQAVREFSNSTGVAYSEGGFTRLGQTSRKAAATYESPDDPLDE